MYPTDKLILVSLAFFSFFLFPLYLLEGFFKFIFEFFNCILKFQESYFNAQIVFFITVIHLRLFWWLFVFTRGLRPGLWWTISLPLTQSLSSSGRSWGAPQPPGWLRCPPCAPMTSCVSFYHKIYLFTQPIHVFSFVPFLISDRKCVITWYCNSSLSLLLEVVQNPSFHILGIYSIKQRMCHGQAHSGRSPDWILPSLPLLWLLLCMEGASREDAEAAGNHETPFPCPALQI